MLRLAQDLSIAICQQGAPEVMAKPEGITKAKEERAPAEIDLCC